MGYRNATGKEIRQVRSVSLFVVVQQLRICSVGLWGDRRVGNWNGVEGRGMSGATEETHENVVTARFVRGTV
jgi:hypothetical protein